MPAGPPARAGKPPQLLFNIIKGGGAAGPSRYSVQGCLKFSLVPGLVPLGSELVSEAGLLTEWILITTIWQVFGAWFRLGSAWFRLAEPAQTRIPHRAVCNSLCLCLGCACGGPGPVQQVAPQSSSESKEAPGSTY